MRFVAAGPIAAAVGCCTPGWPPLTGTGCLAPAGSCEAGQQPSCRSVAVHTALLVGTSSSAMQSAVTHQVVSKLPARFLATLLWCTPGRLAVCLTPSSLCVDNFYLSKEELLHDSPSRRAGVDADAEAQLRNFGCQRIQLGVLYLKLPQASRCAISLYIRPCSAPACIPGAASWALFPA